MTGADGQRRTAAAAATEVAGRLRVEPPAPLDRRDAGLAGAAALFVVVHQLVWLSQDTTEAGADSLTLLRIAACFSRGMSALSQCVGSDPHPPVVTVLAAVHARLLGHGDARVAAMALWPFFGLGAAALYLSVRQAADRLAGLTAVALATVVFADTGMRGAFTTENALFWCLPVVVACLVASRRFTRPGVSFLVGATAGLALLVKWSAAFFLFAPVGGAAALALGGLARPRPLRLALTLAGGTFLGLVAVALSGRWAPAASLAWVVGAALALGIGAALHPRLRAPEARRRLLGLGAAALGVALVAGPWYAASLPVLRQFFARNVAGAYDGELLPITAVWWFYPATLALMVQTPILVLAAVGAIRSGRRPVVIVSVFALLAGMFVLAWLPYRVGRYLIPGYALLVAPAVLATVGLGRVTRVVQGGLLAFALVHQAAWWVAAAAPPEPDRTGPAIGVGAGAPEAGAGAPEASARREGPLLSAEAVVAWLGRQGTSPHFELPGNDTRSLQVVTRELYAAPVRIALVGRRPLFSSGLAGEIAREAAALGATERWAILATEGRGFESAHIEVRMAFDGLGRWVGTFAPGRGLADVLQRHGRAVGVTGGRWPQELLLIEFVPLADPRVPVLPPSQLGPELTAAGFVLVRQWAPKPRDAGGLYLWRGPGR